MPYIPFVDGLTLGVSPEVLNPYWQQFSPEGFPSGINCCGIMTDLAVIYQLSNAQLLALQTTAVQLVAAPISSGIPGYLVPPGGYMFTPTGLTLQAKAGVTAFTIGNADNKLQIEYTGQSVNLLSILATGILDQTTNKFGTNFAAATGPIIAANAGPNLGLEVKLTGTTPALTLGTGTATLQLIYNAYVLV